MSTAKDNEIKLSLLENKVLKASKEKDKEITELKKANTDLVAKDKKNAEYLTGLETELHKLKTGNERTRINNISDKLLTDNGYKFKNNFERDGFNTTIFKKKEDGSFYADDEVSEIIAKFLKDQIPDKDKDKNDDKDKDKNKDKGRDKSNQSDKETNNKLIEELRGLLDKPTSLTKEETSRLNEIQKEMNKIK